MSQLTLIDIRAFVVIRDTQKSEAGEGDATGFMSVHMLEVLEMEIK